VIKESIFKKNIAAQSEGGPAPAGNVMNSNKSGKMLFFPVLCTFFIYIAGFIFYIDNSQSINK